jgi:hypothetical protein
MRSLALAAAMVLAAWPAGAAIVRDCDTGEARADNLMMPPAQSIRTFANGAVRLMWLDTIEPACCSSHLMVTLPAPEELGLVCVLISRGEWMGYGGFDLPRAQATYDPATGLTVQVPANIWNGEEMPPVWLTLTVNQGAGTVTAGEAPR